MNAAVERFVLRDAGGMARWVEATADGWGWTLDHARALRFWSRESAETFLTTMGKMLHTIKAVPELAHDVEDIAEMAVKLLVACEDRGFVVRIWQESHPPLAMGRYLTRFEIRPVR